MEVHACFAVGSKGVLVAVLRALKDLNRSNTLNLRFSEERGLNSHFSCGPSGDAKAAFASFRLFAKPSDLHEVGGGAAAAPGSTTTTGPQDAVESPSSPNPNSNLHAWLLRMLGPASGAGGSPASAAAQTIAPSSLFSSLSCNPEVVNTNDDPDGADGPGLVVSLAVHPKTIFQQLELVDDFDRIELRSEKADIGCELYFESIDLGRKVLYEMDFVPKKIDPVIHRLPTPPASGYAFVVQIEAKEYVRTIAALHDASDRVTITGTKNAITFESSGANGTLQVGLSQKYNIPNKPVPRCKILVANAPIQQTFNTRYLLAFAHAVHLGTSVILSFPANPSNPVLEALAIQNHQQLSAPNSRAASPTSGNRPESPHPVSPLRPLHSHLRISHPIEVVGVTDPLGSGAQVHAFKLATVAVSNLARSGSSVASANVEVARERDTILESRKIVGFLEYFLAPELGI
ncbi:hypothetical protein HDU82_005817 [Entophlyctis luteolus]|nr:hypothetical protein HDU82_005817 [Entophlyctis luteolus]